MSCRVVSTFISLVSLFDTKGAYFHESFIQDNRQLALEISRIKAPKRRKTPASKVAFSNPSDARPPAAPAPLSPLDRFLPLDRKDLPRGPIRSIKPIMATPKPGFDPVLTFRQQRCSCPHHCNGQGHHVCTHTISKVVSVSSSLSTSSSSSIASDATVSETYNWLINAGVPCSAFDPSPVHNSHDLFECEDEITSLFSDAPDKVPSHTSALHFPLDSPVAAPLNYGFNEVDATLDIPQDMLSDLNSTIWDL